MRFDSAMARPRPGAGRSQTLGVLAAAILAACGSSGGGGGAVAPIDSAPLPPPDNAAPRFAGVLAVAAPENADLLIPLAVTDPDHDPLTLSLAGEDAALFILDAAARTVSAKGPFDFEAPTDRDGDNIYRFGLTISDGLAEIALDFTVTVTNVSDAVPAAGAPFDVAVEGGQVARVAPDVFDADGDALALTRQGADPALLALDANAREAATNQSFDFESPIDTDGDNVYAFREDGVSVTVPDVAFAGFDTTGGRGGVDPTGGREGFDDDFFYANGGVDAPYVVDVPGAGLLAVKSSVGSGFAIDRPPGNTQPHFETFRPRVTTGSGSQELTLGEVFGIRDSSGIDALVSNVNARQGDKTALPLDPLSVERVSVPEPAMLGLLFAGLLMVFSVRPIAPWTSHLFLGEASESDD